MANEFAKALKQKRDAELRLQNQTQKPVVIEKSDGSYYAPEPQDYTSQLAAGKNISILTSGNIKTINALMNIFAGSNIAVSAPDSTGAVTISGTIAGKGVNITDFAGKNGYVLKYDSATDKFILSQQSSSISQATETVLGGVKAKAKTSETAEVAIDTATGKLYAPASGGSGSGLPAAGTAGQLLKKNSATDGDASWSNPPIILNSPGGIDIETFENAAFKFPTNILSGWVKTSGGLNSLTCLSDTYSNSPADVRFTVNLATAGKLTFYYKSQMQAANYPQYSGHTLTIDGISKKVYTANVPTFTKDEFDISAGSHEIRFYKHAVTHASQFWIDDISLPGNGQYDMEAVFQNPLALLKVSSSGNNVGFLKTIGDVLPTASEWYRGHVFTVKGSPGVADVSYICLKNSSDAYAWQQI